MLMGSMDSILMLRGRPMPRPLIKAIIIACLTVYALHKKDRTVGALLVTLFCGQTVVHALCGKLAADVPYDAVCDSLETHKAVVYFW